MSSTNRRGRLRHRQIRLTTTGAAGSAVATGFMPLMARTMGEGLNTAAIVRAIAVDYTTQPATTDLLVKADSSTGATLLTASNTNTDIALTCVGMPGIDEATAAIAVTDASAGGWPIRYGLYFDVAQGDPVVDGLVIDVLVEEVAYRRVTVAPVGVDGSAVVTRLVDMNRPGFVRAIAVDYQNQPATTDLVIKRDSSAGTTLLTNTNGNTDIPAKPVGNPAAIDETNAATAATDATDGGWPFLRGLYIDVAQADGQTSGDELIVLDFWMDI